jgi:hypothetical protein
VCDGTGQSFAYVYGHADQRDAGVASALTLDEARRIASNIAKLPGLLGKAKRILASPRLTALKNHRDKHLAHSLASTKREKKAGGPMPLVKYDSAIELLDNQSLLSRSYTAG